MPDLFGVDIKGILGDAVGDGFPELTVISVTPGTRNAGDPGGGTQPTTSNSTARGIMESYRDREIDGTRVKTGDRRVLILGASLATGVVPKPGDQIIAEGKTWTIADDGVSRDPAEATYTCQVREAS